MNTYQDYPSNSNNDKVLEILTRILGKNDERFDEIYKQVAYQNRKNQNEVEALQEQVHELLNEQKRLRQYARSNEELVRDLRVELEILRRKRSESDHALMERMTPMMSDIIGKTINKSRQGMAEALGPLMGDAIRVQIRESRHEIANAIGPLMGDAIRVQIKNSPDEISEAIGPLMGDAIRVQIKNSPEELAEAMGPVMGDAIRVQVRESREDIVEAIYPIIGQTGQRAVSQFAREIQRNIDFRLRGTFSPTSLLRFFSARLRGVSVSELIVRQGLPFQISQIFVIQRDSGLLLAHNDPDDVEDGDLDLIGGMLTAIRDFVQDSFAQEGEERQLDQVQWGDQSIIIQNGPAAYVAVVIEGVEPQGFHAALQDFTSELHIRHAKVLRDYEGDENSLPNLQPALLEFMTQSTGIAPPPQKVGSKAKFALGGMSIFGLLFLGLFCFYIQFTVALFPLARPAIFPWSLSPIASPTPTATMTPTVTPSMTPTLTATATHTHTATATHTHTATATHTHTATATHTHTATATHTVTPTQTPTTTHTPEPPTATSTATATKTPTVTVTPTPSNVIATGVTIGSVWAHIGPAVDSERILALTPNTTVEIIQILDAWAKVKLEDVNGVPRQGWVSMRFIEIVKYSDTN